MKHVYLPLICSLLLAVPSTAASKDKTDELIQMRQLIEQQQEMIRRLEQNQAQQAAEISELKQLLEGHTSESIAASASQPQESQKDVSERNQQPSLALGPSSAPDATTVNPSSLLKSYEDPSDQAISVGININRAVNVVNDGSETETYFVDNSNYPTLFYLKTYKQLNDHLKVSGHLEYSLQYNATTVVSQDNQDAGLNTSLRFAEITLDSNKYGKLWFGRGFMSSFLVVEVDQSGTWRYNQLSTGNSFGGMKFVDSRDNSLSPVQVNAVYLDLEAFSFRDRIRYDSPDLGGLRISASAGSGDSGDLTLRWNADTDQMRFFVGGSWQTNPVVGRIDDRLDGGFGMFHAPTGLNFSLGLYRQDYKQEFYENFGRNDGRNTGGIVRLGLKRNWTSWGETRVALDYGLGEDVLWSQDRANTWGLFFGQMIDFLGMELYAGYRIYDYDTGPNSDGLELYSMDGFTIGARVGADATMSK